MKTAVVILNWNGKKLLETYLPTVVAHSKEATIYVADNASTDDSVAYVTSKFPTVKIIQNTTNGGYAKGYNEALKHLDEDLLVLLNSDVAVTENWLTPVFTAFQNNKNLAAAQPKILDDKNKTHFEYAGAAGGFIDALGYPYCRGRIFNTIEEDKGQYNDTTTIFWATGACLFIRNTDFKKVGGFDQSFFAHQEEIDLCWRLHGLEKEVKYIGTSTVYHLGGATLETQNPKKTFYNFRNSLLMMVKNIPGLKVIPLLFIRMVLDSIAAFQLLLQAKPLHFFAVLKSHFSFYYMLPGCLAKRRQIKKQKDYATLRSIVWQYFINRKRFYNDLN
ncbi:b-glycosyltransferase, glycosyltransferase family 2 protein [unidentified eubacterium SCB49]|nr:b-glycosyltransferase, glycosyltransferase family 2 protein [unidentified eubacterium SCB49]